MNASLFDQINAFARATPWLHGVITAYAAYGVVVFALLLGAGWWSARRSGEPKRMAAVVCAGAATFGQRPEDRLEQHLGTVIEGQQHPQREQMR